MAYVILWFILTNGSGYLEPLRVDPAMMRCGLAGAVTGVQLDRLVNPQTASWPDPYFPGVHCEVDISAKVASLVQGEYHVATTEVGVDVPFGTPVPRYIGIDPHTSELWRRDGTVKPPTLAPANLRLRPQQ